jgi:D-beta-D-heptose 7-phosphate kinase/D-beta-D-heptose 1-phosphate adenosyltransferase
VKVFTNGCFDVLHRGHIEILKYCASLGDVTVGLNSDSSVSRLKGSSRPLVSEQDRKKILESIKYVGSVHIFDEDTPYELIKTLRPDLIVKGGDYKAEEVAGFDLCEVRIFNTVEGYSSSELINRISKSNVIQLDRE